MGCMGERNLPDYIEYLLRADSYPHPVDDVQLIETHISYVILAGSYVYKWKKSIELGFLDFSSLEKRKIYCEREVLLNRRLCPEVYLGVVSIAQQAGSFCLAGSGLVVEYGVKMVRLPEDRMMNALIQRKILSRTDIDRIVRTLVPFYENAQSSEAIKKCGTVDVVAENVLENLSQAEAFLDDAIIGNLQFEEIRDYSVNFLHNKALFSQRLESGKIRDCHGDLHAGNICLAETVCIFDCIEFSDRLRCGDVAADVAFLAMDLELHGLEYLSDYFIERFIADSGDSGLISMLAFYKCYRACVRGKINLLTANSAALDAEGVSRYKAQAKSCFTLAWYVSSKEMKKSQRGGKLVLVFFGMTATGKSYVARAWAERWHNPYLNSDLVRKELAGRLSVSREKSAINDGIYSPAFTRLTYDELLRRAEQVLLKDETSGVVLDASYQSHLERDFVRSRFMPECRVIFVHCTCSDEVVRKRLDLRANDPQAVSDGNVQVFLEQKKNFEMPRELEPELLVTLETDKDLSELLQDLQAKMRAMGEVISLSSSTEKKIIVSCEKIIISSGSVSSSSDQ